MLESVLTLYSSLTQLRFLLIPSLFTIFTLTLTLSPPTILDTVPPFLPPSSLTPPDSPPILPPTRSDAYAYGELAAQMAATSPSSPEMALLLDSAAALAGRTVSVDEVMAIKATLSSIESGRGVAARLYGMLTLVNLVWLISIAGMAAFALPALHTILAPVAVFLQTVLRDVFVPLLLRLRPLWEFLAFTLCAMALTEAVRGLQSGLPYAHMLALTAVAMAIPCYAHSVHLHATGGGDLETFTVISGLLVASWFLPVAVLFEDSLMAWVGVLGVYSALGFSVVPIGLGLAFGFQKNAIFRVAATSALLLCGYGGIRAFLPVDPKAIKLLAGPVSIMGTITLCLAELIFASKYSRYHWGPDSHEYAARQTLFIVTLSCLISAGSLLHIPGMFNTGLTFGVLYVVEKVLELPWLWSRGMVPVTLLFVFMGLYALSYFLSSHPHWLSSVAFNL